MRNTTPYREKKHRLTLKLKTDIIHLESKIKRFECLLNYIENKNYKFNDLSEIYVRQLCWKAKNHAKKFYSHLEINKQNIVLIISDINNKVSEKKEELNAL